MAEDSSEFGRVRSFLWPIHRYELRRYLPIFLVILFLGVDYHILRNLKYGLLVLAPDAGAEAIAFVQLWGLVPGAVVMTWLLSMLSRRLSQSRILYVTVVGFLGFFALFQFVLYPAHAFLEPTALVGWMRVHFPRQLSGFIAMIQHWEVSLFYVAAELWKVSVVAVLFWGFVNTNIPFSKATRLYGPLMIASGLAGLIGGKITSVFPKAEWVQRVGFGESPWERALSIMILTVIVVGILSLLLFRFLERQNAPTDAAWRGSGKEPTGFSVREAFRSLMRSPYLLALGFIVAADYVAFGLGEILWKDQLKTAFPDPLQFTAYTGSVIFWASILSMATSAVLSGGLINRLGWAKTALIPPIILLASSVVFYIFVLFPETGVIQSLSGLCGVTPLIAAVFLGGVHNCVCRVAKYSLVDPCKELAFVPLDKQTQIQGKAVVDGIGMHAGRAGGAFVQQLLLFAFPSVIAGAPVSLVVLLAIGVIWLRSVSYVGKRYQGLAQERVPVVAGVKEAAVVEGV